MALKLLFCLSAIPLVWCNIWFYYIMVVKEPKNCWDILWDWLSVIEQFTLYLVAHRTWRRIPSLAKIDLCRSLTLLRVDIVFLSLAPELCYRATSFLPLLLFVFLLIGNQMKPLNYALFDDTVHFFFTIVWIEQILSLSPWSCWWIHLIEIIELIFL